MTKLLAHLSSPRWALACSFALLAALPAQDAERATHADDAATPQVSFESERDGVLLRQYQLGCLSQLTYLIVSGTEALVVDPQRDVDFYVRDAAARGATIRHVALTHTNADFVAGHTELAARTGASILVSAESGSQFPHRGMKDGERITLGTATIEFWATPGHTLDSMTLLVSTAPDGAPRLALTGDTLFVGSIGRPDLASGVITPMALADRAFDSVQRLKTLPDETVILPGHGAGSLCGAHLSPDTTSTIGREKQSNPYFAITSRSSFVARDVSDLPPAPRYFAFNVAMNRAGPPVIGASEALPPALGPQELATAVAEGAWLVDVRDARSYAEAHLSGSVNVGLRGRLDTWTGVVVPFEAPLVLIGSEDEVREAAFRFRRIGLDHVRGHLAGGIAAARAAGLDVRSTPLVPPQALAAQLAAGTEPIVVDVRTAAEFAELRIGDHANLDVTDWERFGQILDRQRPVLFVCNSAYRSSLAVGLAERLGFRDVASLEGGLDAWLDAGLPVHGTAPICVESTTGDGLRPASAPGASAALRLPEAIEPQALASGRLDRPEAYVVIDVRPGWQFADGHVPGAVNLAPEAVAAHVAALPRHARVVLCDRDGTLAWAIAGDANARLGDDARDLRVLAGGVTRYWREITLGAAPVAPATVPAPTAAPQSVPAKAAPRKRSAGC